jgi:hypothetical protein
MAPVPRLRAARPDVSEVIERSIGKALAKVPGARFATAAEFATALAAEPSRHSARWRQLRRPVTMLAAAAVLALLGGGVWRWRGVRRPPRSDVVAILPFRVGGADPESARCEGW